MSHVEPPHPDHSTPPLRAWLPPGSFGSAAQAPMPGEMHAGQPAPGPAPPEPPPAGVAVPAPAVPPLPAWLEERPALAPPARAPRRWNRPPWLPVGLALVVLAFLTVIAVVAGRGMGSGRQGSGETGAGGGTANVD